MLVLQVIAFFYILIFAKESEASTTDVEDCSNGSLKIYFVLVDGESKSHLKDSYQGYCGDRSERFPTTDSSWWPNADTD